MFPGYYPFRGYIQQEVTADGQIEVVGTHIDFPRSRGYKRFLKRHANRAVRRVPPEGLPRKSSCRKIYDLTRNLY